MHVGLYIMVWEKSGFALMWKKYILLIISVKKKCSHVGIMERNKNAKYFYAFGSFLRKMLYPEHAVNLIDIIYDAKCRFLFYLWNDISNSKVIVFLRVESML